MPARLSRTRSVMASTCDADGNDAGGNDAGGAPNSGNQETASRESAESGILLRLTGKNAPAND